MNVLTDCDIIWLDDRDINGEDLAVNLQFYVIHSLRIFTDLITCSSFILHCTSDSQLLLVVVRDRYVNELIQKTLCYLRREITWFIYLLYDDKFLFHWKTDCRIREIFHITEEDKIVKKLQEDLETYLIQRWSSGYCVFNNENLQTALDQINAENAKFMWFQLLIQVFLRMPSTAKSKDDLLQQSFLAYSDNFKIQDEVHKFNRTYQAKDAINWYTKTGFLYRLFNQACRTDDIDLLFSFRFFIRDLYERLTELYIKQRTARNPKETLTVYRGTILSKDELDMLLTPSSEKKIIWFTSFVSGSRDREVARKYVGTTSNDNQVSVLQEIHIDDNTDMSTSPFADIHEFSQIPDELEILMAIGSVFEIESIKENNDHIWEMKLNMVKYDDRIREKLYEHLKEDIEEETSLITLSHFLLMKGDFEKSEKYNKRLLEELSIDHPDRPLVHNNLGYTYQKMTRLIDALQNLNQSIDLYLKNKTSQLLVNFNRRLACAYNNKGLVLHGLGDFTTALECIQKSLDLRQDDVTLSETQRDRLAVERSYCHENLGLLYNDMSNYKLALHHLQETLNIRNEKLPSNHQMIAQVYNNLSRIYTYTGNLAKAFECTEQALARQIQALPENHPHRGTMYNSLGEAYYRQGQWSMALANFEKALRIDRTGRTRNPVLEATTLSNIGSVMKAQGKYREALPIFLDTLPIIQREKPRHPNVARCLNNIGFVYREMGDHSAATNYFKQALDFCQSYLPENNEVTAISYLSLGGELVESQSDLAIEYFQRVIIIYNQINLPHHANVINSLSHRGRMYRNENNHQSALACFEEALFHCREGSLPQRHHLWVLSYTDCAREYYLMNEYQRAIEEHEHALEHITEESLDGPAIRSAIELCRKKLVEIDVRQTIEFLLNEVMHSYE